MATTSIKFGFRDDFDRSAFLKELSSYSGWRGDTSGSSGILMFMGDAGPVQLDYSTEMDPNKTQGKYAIVFRASGGPSCDVAFDRLTDHAARHNHQSVNTY